MTNVHRDLQYKSLIWLQGRATARGIRAAIEVSIAENWIADAVALFNLQARFHDRFAKQKRYKLLIYYSGLFEIKVSRSDFQKDFGNSGLKGKEYPCNLHWIVTPHGLVKESEVPKYWGLLEVSKSKRGLTEVKSPLFVEQSWPTLHSLADSILWKNDFRAGGFWDRERSTKKFLEESWARQELKLEFDSGTCF